MGIVSRWFNSWCVGTQKKELQAFIDGLASMDGPEIGSLLVVASHIRNNLEESGCRLLDPLVDYPRDPTIVLRLRGMIREYQRTKQLIDASGTMVWLHTMRVGGQHELRPLAREMWRQLERGFPYVDTAAFDILRLTLKLPKTKGYDQFPAGLTPDPL